MKIKDFTEIHSGYITRGKIQAAEDGSHYLVQAKDVDGENLIYRRDQLIRFNPALSRADICLRKGDLIFMARGAHNFTIEISDLPEPALAAACFFVLRISDPNIHSGYLAWYLNQAPVARYLVQHSGRGVNMPVVRRAALENIDVPTAPMAVQLRIADINALMAKEVALLNQLGHKRKEMVTAACLQAILTGKARTQ